MAEFSLDGYSELLSTFKERGYSFRGFEEIDTNLAKGHPFLVLRHDIDLSLRPALEIARIEHEQGVQATYFVLLRSPFYNVFSRSNAEMMSQIHGYGHQIATHIDLAFYDDDWANALMEVEILSKCYPFINTQLVSLHSSYDLHRIPIDVFQQFDNVYGSAVRGDVAYISDSTGRWRYGHPSGIGGIPSTKADTSVNTSSLVGSSGGNGHPKIRALALFRLSKWPHNPQGISAQTV